MIPRDRRPGRLAREVVLSIGAVIGVVCIVAAVAAALFGLRPLIFRSGSMSPTIDTGALAISKNVPSSALNVGDIVMVKTAGGTNVTHRIVTVTHRSNYATVALKGDANKAADAQAYDVANADRVLFSIPKAGYAVTWLAGPLGLFLLGLYAAFLVFVLFFSSGRSNKGDPHGKAHPHPRPGGGRRAQRSSRRIRGRSAAVLLMAACVATGSISAAGPTWALGWTDPVTVSGTTLSAHLVLPPNSVTCSGGGLGSSLTFTWPNKDLRYRYRVQVEKPAGTIVNTAFVANKGTVGSNQTYVLSLGLLGSLLGVSSTFTVRVRSELIVASTWVSATGPTDTGTFTLGVLSSC